MADFPPNLDDGELCLPYDIYPDEVPAKYSPHLPCINDVAQHFATYTLLQPNQITPKPPPNLQLLRPSFRYDAAGSSPSTHISVNGGLGVRNNLYFNGAGDFVGVRCPLYRYYFLEPGQLQVDSSVQMRARVSQRQQNSFQNRVLPVQGSGFGPGGFVRELGGTGVFLPRVATTDVRKKQGARNRQEIKVRQQRHSIKRIAVGKKQEDCFCNINLSPDMGLPQDWTY